MVDIPSPTRKKWKEHILDLFIEHPEYNATQVRQGLIEVIGEELTPGKSAIQKEWARLRSENDITSEIDAGWHLGTLDRYPVDTTALPVLLEFQHTESSSSGRRLTIRQAKWISRLHGVIDDREMLLGIARHYAVREKTSELSGQPIFTTTQYDLLLHDPETLLMYFKEEKTILAESVEARKKSGISSLQIPGGESAREGRKASESPVDSQLSPPAARDSVQSGYLLVHELFFYGDKILIRINVRGTVKRVVLPFSSQEELMNQLQSEQMIESMNSIGNDVTHIVLNKPLSISTENKQFREYLLHESQNVDIPGIARRNRE